MNLIQQLEQEEIDAADIVILAVAIGIEGEERFEEKEELGRVLTVEPGEMIKHPEKYIDEAIKLVE